MKDADKEVHDGKGEDENKEDGILVENYSEDEGGATTKIDIGDE
jgi:hypothetical protein